MRTAPRPPPQRSRAAQGRCRRPRPPGPRAGPRQVTHPRTVARGWRAGAAAKAPTPIARRRRAAAVVKLVAEVERELEVFVAERVIDLRWRDARQVVDVARQVLK